MIETRTMAARTITALLVSFACLGLSASAMAAEIARPLFWKTTVRIKPNGPTDGVILAAARSGGPSGFLVLKTREVEGQEWLALRIGERPNDRVGWVPAFRVEVIEARISHLAYSPEIAAAMLQRQQASAVVAARTLIVEGAVGMVELALDRLKERGVIELTDTQKADMVGNLLVVLCSDRPSQPVVKAGS